MPKGLAVFFPFVIVIALVIGGAMFHVVPVGHRGIRVTLGRVHPEALQEGLAFKWPFLEAVIDYPIKQITQSSTATCFSSDLQTVTVSYSTLYRLPEQRVVELFQKFAGDPYTTLVEPRIQETLKEVTAAYRAEDVVKKREEVKNKVLGKLRTVLQELITINDLTINNVDLTAELEKAIELKQVMEQQALAKVYELQKAQRESEITIVNAKAEAESVKIKGEALQAAPEVIQLEIAKKWDGKTPNSVVVGAGGANVLLPLK
jgi:prohibitin 2